MLNLSESKKMKLDENGFEYESRHIKEENPTYEELKNGMPKAECRLKIFSTQAVCSINPCS